MTDVQTDNDKFHKYLVFEINLRFKTNPNKKQELFLTVAFNFANLSLYPFIWNPPTKLLVYRINCQQIYHGLTHNSMRPSSFGVDSLTESNAPFSVRLIRVYVKNVAHVSNY